MTLNRLAQPQVERMVERIAGGKALPTQVLTQISEKTDGVPLFVEELTKAVLEAGMLQDVDGQYVMTGTLSSFAIPATLHDSLMARLDRLVTAKAVAQYAAVIGRQFSYELLAAVSRLDPATLQRELGRLVAAELLYQRGLPRLGAGNIFFLPVVITTAKLWATDTDISLASTETGEIEDASVSVNPMKWLWYQYPQSPGLKHSAPNNFCSHDLREILYHEFVRPIAIARPDGLDELLSASMWEMF